MVVGCVQLTISPSYVCACVRLCVVTLPTPLVSLPDSFCYKVVNKKKQKSVSSEN